MSGQHTASSLTGLPVKDRVRRIGLIPPGRAIPGLRSALPSAMRWQRAHGMFLKFLAVQVTVFASIKQWRRLNHAPPL